VKDWIFAEKSFVKTENLKIWNESRTRFEEEKRYAYYWFEMISWIIKIWVCDTHEPFEGLTRLNNVFR
jgi:hypothetical protein